MRLLNALQMIDQQVALIQEARTHEPEESMDGDEGGYGEGSECPSMEVDLIEEEKDGGEEEE